jgi:predicted glutamine amidotransferase
MCRWLAYTGASIRLTEVLYTPVHSLIEQSLHSRLGAETTNGDGFGVGWYDAAPEPEPGVFRSIEPAWNDQNLRELAGHISSRLFFAHVRAAIGSAVQQTNCHPFRHGRWLFMHNGFIDGFAAIKRDLVLAVDESLYPEIQGTSDTEVLFHLALTFGMGEDAPGAVARAIGFVEACGLARGVAYPFQGTVATTDGETVWAFRYSSQGKSRSLFYTSARSGGSIPARSSSARYLTTRGSWSPSRSATCPARGRKCPRRPMPSFGGGKTGCSPSPRSLLGELGHETWKERLAKPIQ